MATYQEQLERLRREKEEKAKAEELSAKQIDNWRGVLAHMGIPFARSMPVEMVQRFRDALQGRVNAEFGSSESHSRKSDD